MTQQVFNPKVPPALRRLPLDLELENAGLRMLHQGKVRNTFALPQYSHLLLPVTTNRVSIHDHVLNALVSEKGRVLNRLSVFWLTSRLLLDIPTHLVAAGPAIDQYLPHDLRGHEELHSRAIVARKLTMLPVESIVRGYLTGSGWKAYQKTREVCGIKLRAGLHDGSKLPLPLFTPTNKAEVGHDEHLNAASVAERYPGLAELSLEVYNRLADYAIARGIILADTKLEFGELNGRLVLGDEVGTPDSSRLWTIESWVESNRQHHSPAGFDKEPLRKWGEKVAHPWGTGTNTLQPENPEHVDWVHSLEVPAEQIARTSERYQEILSRLTQK